MHNLVRYFFEEGESVHKEVIHTKAIESLYSLLPDTAHCRISILSRNTKYVSIIYAAINLTQYKICVWRKQGPIEDCWIIEKHSEIFVLNIR
ncbi:hypothetical protein ALC57_18169 [Trachymyrmex cornetzi]|uniref:Uncharacterized protein n=1 Tax=Trachymyrmex cornetzi TaxID=471704 RepID=A0A195DB61_9HYME|nr:hypothetical protein ALC57_18169 [Trachymyrmex cornetzi]